MTEEVYLVKGMHCAACAASVEKVTQKLSGVESAEVNLMTEKLYVRYDEKAVKPELIIAKIERAGFSAEIFTEEKQDETASGKGIARLWLMIGLAAILLYVSMGNMFGIIPKWLTPEVNPMLFAVVQAILCLCVMFLGRNFYISGFKSLIHLAPDMNTLVALSSSASFLFSLVETIRIPFDGAAAGSLFFESGATVIALVSVGKYLEAKSKNKTKEAIGRLISLAPETAVRYNISDDTTEEVPVAKLFLGDVILVKEGDRVPVDASVLHGSASADESMLTGESMPVEKNVGDRINAGSMISEGAVYARVDAIGHDTLLFSIVRFVEEAQKKKAPVSRVADKVAGIFVPTVCAIALVTSVIWLLAGKNFAFALRIFTSVLVIACPCAMGLATPTAIMSGTGLGALNGILVRNGEALENLSKIDTVVFDKTGTITNGTLSVSSVCPAAGYTENELLTYAYSLEILSNHPIATAVSSFAQKRGAEARDVENFDNIVGCGLTGVIGGKRIKVGKKNFIGTFVPDETVTTGIFVSVDSRYAGKIEFADTIRDSAEIVIKRLQCMRIKCILLSGDNRRSTEAVAERLGFDRFYADVLPIDKSKVVTSLMSAGHRVLMCGDGINDAPALVDADIGVAVKNGTDIAIDCADVVLMHESLEGVSGAILLGQKTLKNIKENLFWAFCYNILAIPVACGVLYPAFGLLLTPMIGGIAMSLSSLFVVTNARRLGKAKLK